MEVVPRVSSDDLDPLRESGGGSVRYERECTLPAVLLLVSLPAEGGRADIALASSQAVCVSSKQYIATGVMQDQGGRGFGDTHRPELAEPALVPGPDRDAGGAALADPRQEGSAISGELSALHSRVLSEARAPSTRRLYALKWGVFVNDAVMFISTRLLAPCWMFCVFYSTDWIVDLYHQHWKSMWPLLPRFVPRWVPFS